MKRILTIAAIALLCGISAFAQNTNNSMETKEKSLYMRLGGYDAIAAVSDEFIVKLATGKRLKRFVVGLSDDSKKKLRQHLVDFLCNLTGGPCAYTGRDMKTVHTGLGIDEDDWQEGVDALVAVLDKFKVPEKEKTEVVTAFGTLKKDIVEKK